MIGWMFVSEKDGATDFSPVVSSLTQLMMDPPSRTIPGFQSLIEKEWVALGHRFTYRCGIVYQSDAEEASRSLLAFYVLVLAVCR